jgi:hypothetical protein
LCNILTFRASIVKIYEAAYDACAPQARRRSLQQAGFFARMTEDQYLARQALFNATAVVSIAPGISKCMVYDFDVSNAHLDLFTQVLPKSNRCNAQTDVAATLPKPCLASTMPQNPAS